MADLRKQPRPLRHIHAVLGEYVCRLTVSHHVEEVEQLLLVVPMKESQVDAMLTLKMSHGRVLATADDLARGLVVAAELHGE